LASDELMPSVKISRPHSQLDLVSLYQLNKESLSNSNKEFIVFGLWRLGNCKLV
jgi:hypothetical protein